MLTLNTVRLSSPNTNKHPLQNRASLNNTMNFAGMTKTLAGNKKPASLFEVIKTKAQKAWQTYQRDRLEKSWGIKRTNTIATVSGNRFERISYPSGTIAEIQYSAETGKKISRNVTYPSDGSLKAIREKFDPNTETLSEAALYKADGSLTIIKDDPETQVRTALDYRPDKTLEMSQRYCKLDDLSSLFEQIEYGRHETKTPGETPHVYATNYYQRLNGEWKENNWVGYEHKYPLIDTEH